ncbi:MAG: hypothetical protein P8M80_12325, partial [Pirellulaceae bacterium]|nr:hypothetical protein [Pirellulaceae bacterium]
TQDPQKDFTNESGDQTYCQIPNTAYPSDEMNQTLTLNRPNMKTQGYLKSLLSHPAYRTLFSGN